jgi:hypothetical protein
LPRRGARCESADAATRFAGLEYLPRITLEAVRATRAEVFRERAMDETPFFGRTGCRPSEAKPEITPRI